MGESHHPAFIGNCPTISHTLLVLSIYPVDEFSLNKNEDLGSVQNFALLFLIWCESRELGDRRSSGFPCVKPVVRRSSARVTFRIQQRSSPAKTGNRLNTLTASLKGLHHRPPFGFQVSVRLGVLQMFFFGGGRGGESASGLRLYGIGSSRLVYKNVVVVRSNYISYKKS